MKEDTRMFRTKEDVERLMRKKAQKCLKENKCFRCGEEITKENVSQDALLCSTCFRLWNIVVENL